MHLSYSLDCVRSTAFSLHVVRQHLPEVMLQTCGSKGALNTGRNNDLRICGSRITQTCRGSDEWDHRGNIQSKGVLVGPQNTVQSESLFVFKLSSRGFLHPC